ncbi:MAG: hypothetical protein ACQKBY_03870, partial [Verrucomicrobiales bacterium]
MARLLALLAWLLVASGALAEPLSTASAVAGFPSNNPDQQPEVALIATVSFIDPSGTIFLEDETGATFLNSTPNPSQYQAGQVLEIKGVRIPGLYIGGIRARSITVLSDGPPPPPITPDLKELRSGRFHYRRVRLEGNVHRARATGDTAATLRLHVQGGLLSVRITDHLPDP